MMTEEKQKQNLHKVAVMLTLVGREAARQIIQQFQPRDVERIGNEMMRCTEITREDREKILREIFDAARHPDFSSRVDAGYVEEVLTPNLEPERAQRFFKKIHEPKQIIPFEDLHDTDPEQIIIALENEHPQTITLVVAGLPSELSANILRKLPEAIQKEVAKRIAVLDTTAPDVETVREIEKRIGERIKQEAEKPELVKLGGIQATADILNTLDKDTLRVIMESLETQNEELAAQIKMKMVRFDDVAKLDDMEIQRVLKEVETQDLAVALIRSDKIVEEKIFKNMSQRGAEMLKDDIEVMQNIKPDAIRAARIKIAEAMRRLDDDGTIVLNKQSLEEEID